MCYAASKLWNVCNYERKHYEELGLKEYPDWYYQKKAHKSNLWYKNLPAQTAQEVCKQLDKAWKSFYALEKKHKEMNPRPPRFKQDKTCITYTQKGIVHVSSSNTIRFSLPRQLMDYLKNTYHIDAKYLYLENGLFQTFDVIKQIKLYPPEKGKCDVIVIYEVPDAQTKEDNANYLSIDLGLHNLMTCYTNIGTGKSFIVGRKYLSICSAFDKEISRVQAQWSKYQSGKLGVKYPKSSAHIRKLYKDKKNTIKDYLHKCTREIVRYCVENKINTVVIGDITNIRQDNDHGAVVNQKLHGLPFAQIYTMLSYKLALEGISFQKQEESYSSQCSPLSPAVSKMHACKSNRKERGLYADNGQIFNADSVGAYNILRKYIKKTGSGLIIPVSGARNTEVIKVAV